MRSRIGALLVFMTVLPVGGVQAAEVVAAFEPACLPWQQARYVAEKYFLRMELDVTARLLDEVPVDSLWPVEGRAALMPGERTLALAVVTRGPGHRSLSGDLLLDATTGAILQYASLRGPDPRHRVYRFTASGPQRRTARPVSGEELRSPPAWSNVDIRQRFYTAGTPAAPVLEVSTLLYLLAASGLRSTGDVLRVNGYATSADQVYDVTATVGGQLQLPVNYRETRAKHSRARRAMVDVLPIRIEGRSLSPEGDAAGLEILGLSDVEFLLDPVNRVVAAVRARVPPVGHVEFRLQSLALTSARTARCPGSTP